MEPEILELSGKTVYVIYGNKLLTDVPKKKIKECLEALDAGKTYSRKVKVFTIDQNFKLSFDYGTDKIHFNDASGSHKITYENGNDKAQVAEWLGGYLTGNGFREAKEIVSSSKMVMRGVGTIVLVLFVFGLLFMAEGDDGSTQRRKGRLFIEIANLLGTKGIIIGGVICLIIAIVYTLRLVKRGDEMITYSKI